MYMWRAVNILSEPKNKIGTIAQNESIGKNMYYLSHQSVRSTVINYNQYFSIPFSRC